MTDENIEKDERMEAQEKIIAEHNKKREEFIKNMIIHTAYYPSIDNRAAFYIEYSHDGDNQSTVELVRTSVESDILTKTLEVFSYEEILENTQERENKLIQMNEEFEQFVQWKNEGKIPLASWENENSNAITQKEFNLETIEKVNTEELFKLKLEIFEKEEVQNSENREMRSAIRKSKDAIELLHYYWMIKNETIDENE